MSNYIILVPLLPLLGFLLNVFLGKKHFSKAMVTTIALGSVALAFLVTVITFFEFLNSGEESIKVTYYQFAQIGSFSLPFSLLVDPLSLLMMLVVTGVGFLIHIYAVGYMSHDVDYPRFFSYLNLFMFSMLLLVSSANYFFLFIGWEGVGVSSFLLIGFWFKNTNFTYAGMKAMLMNRTGDLGFFAGIMLIYVVFGSLEFDKVFSRANDFESGTFIITMITILLFIGASAKSAQIPLYTWLPDAMAGPTPVSALMHAATMVTAGIYLIARSNILFALAPVTLNIVAITGLCTALLAAFIALSQNDIKKVLAYSTVSQLGYMCMALGVTAFSSAMFHFMTHAFFKALLFLCAGSIIHAMSNEQDVRNMGGLKKHLPITFLTFLLATLAIAGIPPLSGFFSKDEILVHAFEYNVVFWGFALFGALLTSFYMFRLLFLTFYGEFRGTHEQKHHLHESPNVMTYPLIILAVLSAIGGFVGIPQLLGGSQKFDKFLEPVFSKAELKLSHLETAHLSHATEWTLMGVSIALIIMSILLARRIYFIKKIIPVSEKVKLSFWHNLSYHKFYIDELYRYILIRPMHFIHDFLNLRIEAGIIDRKVNGTGDAVMGFSKYLRLLQNGKTGYYIFGMVIGLVVLLALNFIF